LLALQRGDASKLVRWGGFRTAPSLILCPGGGKRIEWKIARISTLRL